jgi:hypothetical protein
MKLISKSFAEGHPIPSEFAFAVVDPATRKSCFRKVGSPRWKKIPSLG